VLHTIFQTISIMWSDHPVRVMAKTLKKMNGNQIIFTLSNIEDLIYGVTFDLSSGSGRIVTNISLIDRGDVDNILHIFRDVMLSGLTVSPLAKMLSPGESVNDFIIPNGKCGIATVCSITVDGILLKHGIPVKPRFGGLVEVKDGNPVRFTDLVRYDSTTIDPMEVLMSQSMTSVSDMLTIGSGKILANLREITMNARNKVEETLDDMVSVGFGGILEVGDPNSDVLGVSVERDHFGVVVAGGTNPMAVAQEQGFRIDTHAMSSLMDVGDMVPIDRLV